MIPQIFTRALYFVAKIVGFAVLIVIFIMATLEACRVMRNWRKIEEVEE